MAPARAPRVYYALLGDMAGSRALAPPGRARVQRRFLAALQELNRAYRRALAARFVVSAGDAFQGLLASPAPVLDIVHQLRADLPEVTWTIACGRGTLTTPLRRTAAEVDGPCFHAARRALEDARRTGRALAFGGFDAATTGPLEGLAAYYSALERSWTPRQRRTVALLRLHPPADVARRLGVGPSAVSHLAGRAGWDHVRAGDAALRALLEAS